MAKTKKTRKPHICGIGRLNANGQVKKMQVVLKKGL